jgi:hypothetical protein
MTPTAPQGPTLGEVEDAARLALRTASIECACGHAVGWHGEDYEGGCSFVGCDCPHNAHKAHGHGIVPDALIDAYRAAVLAAAGVSDV